MIALIAATGFFGGAAIHEFNVPGRSWWESEEDAKATFGAGVEGAATSMTVAGIVADAAVAVTGIVADYAIKTNNVQLFQWGASGGRLPPSQLLTGWENTRPGDLVPGRNGISLSDLMSSGDYKTPSTLIGAPPELANTTKYIYAIDSEGTILTGRAGLHHPDLVNGERVFGAGELYINQAGKIVLINDQSGHYLPNGSEFFPYMQDMLKRMGIDTSGVTFVPSK